ncbi:UNVERIFIED_CONTAM: hypothetical protein K2H54_003977 [Gekko kuhli]
MWYVVVDVPVSEPREDTLRRRLYPMDGNELSSMPLRRPISCSLTVQPISWALGRWELSSVGSLMAVPGCGAGGVWQTGARSGTIKSQREIMRLF